MPRVWGSWSATSSTGARYRVGLDYSISGTRITVDKYVFESAYSIYKSVTLRRTGKLSGTYSVRADTAGGVVSLGRGGSFTGSRGSTYTVGGKVTNILHGLTCSVSAKIKIPAAAPSKPSKPSIGSITNTRFKATLSKAPASNGASISRYEWQVQNVDSGGTATANTSGRTWTRTNNKPNTRYRVRVRARNSAGVSAYSSWSNTIRTKPNSPAAPTGVTGTRSSDSRINLSWNHRGSSSAPYSSQRVERSEISPSGSWTSWKSLGTVGASASSYADTTTKANQQYRYRVVASNAGGSATSGASSSVRTTPAAPSIGTATKSGDDIRVTYSVNTPYSDHLTHILQDSPDGGAWTTVTTQVGTGTLTHINPDPAVTHRYRVITRSTYGGNLDSAPSNASAIVQLQAPPLAPTILEPSPGVYDASEPLPVKWRHNPVDASEQTGAQVQWREGTSGEWQQRFSNDDDLRLDPPNYEGTFQVRVRTRGDHAEFGPYSSIRTLTLAYRPYGVINEPTPGTLTQSEIDLEWGYSQQSDSPQVAWEGRLWNDDTDELIEEKSVSTSESSGKFDTTLEDGVTYRVELRVRAANGLWSHEEDETWDEVIVTAKFPLPVRYETDVVWDEDAGSAGLTFFPFDEEVVYSWTGPDNDSESTQETAEGTVTNRFKNPDFVQEADGATVRINLLKTPADWNSNRAGWNISLGRPRVLESGEEVIPGISDEEMPYVLARSPNGTPSDPCYIVCGGSADYWADVDEGTEYHALMWVYHSTTATKSMHLEIVWVNADGDVIGDAAGDTVNVSRNSWQELEVSWTAPSGASHAFVRAVVAGYTAAWETSYQIRGTAALLSETSGPYFDGNVGGDDEHVTEWEGGEATSISIMTATTAKVVVWENHARQAQAKSSTFGRFSTGTGGDYDIAWLTNQADGPLPEITNYARATAVTPATSGSGGWNDHTVAANRATLEGSAGDAFTTSVWMRYTGSLETYPVYFRVYAYSGTSSEYGQQSFDIPSGEWVRLHHTFTPEEPYDSVGFWAYFTGGDDIDDGGTIDVTGKMVTKGEHLLHYFDESFSPDPDLTPQPRPGGGSQLVGIAPKYIEGSNGVVVQSQDGGARLINTTGEPAYASVTEPTNGAFSVAHVDGERVEQDTPGVIPGPDEVGESVHFDKLTIIGEQLFDNGYMLDTAGEVVVWENLVTNTSGKDENGDLAWRVNTAASDIATVEPLENGEVKVTMLRDRSGTAVPQVSIDFPGTEGSTYGGSIEVRGEGESVGARARGRVYAGRIMTDNTDLEFGSEFQRYLIPSNGATALASGPSSLNIYFGIKSEGLKEGSVFYLRNPSVWEVPEGEAPLFFFDETFSPDPDLTPQPRPGGGSQLVGQQVAGLIAANGAVVKSSQWAKSGGVSARFITTAEATGNNLPIGIVGVSGSPVGGVVVWRRQDAPIGEFEFPTGASNLSVLFGTGEASDPAVNAPGETLMRVELGEIAPYGGQVYLPGGGNIGDSVWFDNLLIFDEPIEYDGPPFSGASTSRVPADYLTVMRRDPGGPEVTLADNIDPETSMVDPIPAISTETVFWAVSRTELPSSSAGPEAHLVLPGAFLPVYLNSGAGFSIVVPLWDNTELSRTGERGKTRHRRAGRTRPVTKWGAQRNEAFTLTATRSPSTPGGGTIEELFDLEDIAHVACYRDPLGQKFFVTVDSVDASVQRDGHWEVSVPMTSEDFDETAITYYRED